MVNPFLEVINQSLPEPQASLLSGILFGVKYSFPQDFYQALVSTGTIHIIALSGQNISILTKIISDISSPLGRRKSVFISLFGIIAFVIFVGIEATLIRAAIMGSMSLLAVYFGRKKWSLLSLVLAGGLMLIINPAWGANISFQLSFLATLGIILFSQVEIYKPKSSRPPKSGSAFPDFAGSAFLSVLVVSTSIDNKNCRNSARSPSFKKLNLIRAR